MSLGKRHLEILGLLLESDEQLGITFMRIRELLSQQRAALTLTPLERLCNLGFIERRLEGEPWYGEKHSPDKKPRVAAEVQYFYRITDKGKQLLSPRQS